MRPNLVSPEKLVAKDVIRSHHINAQKQALTYLHDGVEVFGYAKSEYPGTSSVGEIVFVRCYSHLIEKLSNSCFVMSLRPWMREEIHLYATPISTSNGKAIVCKKNRDGDAQILFVLEHLSDLASKVLKIGRCRRSRGSRRGRRDRMVRRYAIKPFHKSTQIDNLMKLIILECDQFGPFVPLGVWREVLSWLAEQP